MNNNIIGTTVISLVIAFIFAFIFNGTSINGVIIRAEETEKTADNNYIKARSWRINAPKRAAAIAKLKRYESCWELPKKMYGQKYSDLVSWKNVKGYHNQIMTAINKHEFDRVERMFSEYEDILYSKLSYIESVHRLDTINEIMDTLETRFKEAGLDCERDSYNHITMK